MSASKLPEFRHQMNLDDRWESICPACFATVSTRARESDMAADEATHQCKELALESVLDYFRTNLVVEPRRARW